MEKSLSYSVQYKVGSLTGSFAWLCLAILTISLRIIKFKFLEFAWMEWPTNAEIVWPKRQKWLENGQWPAVILLHTALYQAVSLLTWHKVSVSDFWASTYWSYIHYAYVVEKLPDLTMFMEKVGTRISWCQAVSYLPDTKWLIELQRADLTYICICSREVT